MNKYKTIDENKNELEQFYSAEKFEYKEEDYWVKQIKNLQRYDGTYDQGVAEDEEGEYVLLEDVLNLFSAKKE